MFSSVEQMKQHFGEIDAYMAEKIEAALAARKDWDYDRLRAVAAQVREDGYGQFADKLADLETVKFNQ